jgi:hypothetical protein
VRSAISFSSVMSCFMPKMRWATPSRLSTAPVSRIQRSLPDVVTISQSSAKSLQRAMASARATSIRRRDSSV